MDDRDLHIDTLTLAQLAAAVAELRSEVALIRKELDGYRMAGSLSADPLYDSATVCQLLSISYRQLKTYKQRGEILPLYNGSKCLYSSSEIRRFIDEVLKVKGHKTKTIIKEKEDAYENR